MSETDMKNVLVKLEQASSELSEILDQNPNLAEALKKSPSSSSSSGGEAFKYDKQSDIALMRELADAERSAKDTAQKIYELKLRLAEMCQIPKMTDIERDELEEKNLLLKKYLDLFEEKTRRIQFLIGQKDLFENMISPRPPLQQKHREDMLPRVIICGVTQCCNIPKVIVCEKNKRRRRAASECYR